MVAAAETGDTGYEQDRGFGLVTLTLAGVGAVVGAGVFVITGQAAALYAGPAVTISFLIAGLVCGLTALCYAELSAMIPVAGSAYRFSQTVFGSIPGWVVGWALIAEYLFATGAIAIGWSAYTQDLLASFGIALPAWAAGPPIVMHGHSLAASGTLINLPAAAVVTFLAGVLMLGTGKSARFNGVLVTVKLSAVALFVVFGLAYAHARNWVPFLPERVVTPDGAGAYGWAGVFQASGVVFMAFLGFDAIATAAQETRNPQKTVPLSILLTLAIAMILYVSVSAVMTGLIDFHRLNTAAPLTAALAEAGPALGWLKTYVGVSAAIGLIAGVWASLFALSRLMFSVAQDGLLPSPLARSTSAGLVPRVTVAIAAAGGVLVAGLLPINLLGELISTGTLIAFLAVCAAVIALRIREPNRHRPFSVPFWRVIPALGILSSLFVLYSLGLPAFERILAWQAVGLAIFAVVALRRRRH